MPSVAVVVVAVTPSPKFHRYVQTSPNEVPLFGSLLVSVNVATRLLSTVVKLAIGLKLTRVLRGVDVEITVGVVVPFA